MVQKTKGHILVVDDHVSWREFVRAVLEEESYQVSTASNYDDAVHLLDDVQFDAAILDVRLIDIQIYNVQGISLLRKIKKDRPNIKAVILTGYPDPDQKNKALELYGADAYLDKVLEGEPIDLDGFIELITGLVDRQHV